MRRAGAAVVACVALSALSVPGVAAGGEGRPGATPARAGRSAPAAEEDFLRAFAAAKAQGALVLVDVWAPW